VGSVTGDLSIYWNDRTTTTAVVSGHFRDGKTILTVTGTTDAGSTRFATERIRVVINHPPSPCIASTNAITGTLRLHPLSDAED
jgi:hypothetical protein